MLYGSNNLLLNYYICLKRIAIYVDWYTLFLLFFPHLEASYVIVLFNIDK
jgi:hypothetical protein